MITGATGFIGLHLVKKLNAMNVSIIAIVRPNSQNVGKLLELSNVEVIECEMSQICSISERIRYRDVDACFHLAWEGSSGDARNNYELQMNNVKYSVECMKVASKIRVKRFISIGTIAERLIENIDNADDISVNAMYAISKDYTHKLLNALSKQMGIEFVWCRLTNIYGPGDYTANLVNYTITKLLKGEETEYSNGDGFCNMIYIDDCVEILALIANEEKVKRHTYFIGGSEIENVRYFIEKIKNCIDDNIELGWGKRGKDGILYKKEWLLATDLKKDFDYIARTKFEDGIQKTILDVKERYNE